MGASKTIINIYYHYESGVEKETQLMQDKMKKHFLCSSINDSREMRQLVFDANSTLMPFENQDGNLVQEVPRGGFAITSLAGAGNAPAESSL